MAAAAHNHDNQPCPDPSAHENIEKANRLSAQASTAALYVTHHGSGADSKEVEREHPLGPDGKLSSKSAAASLKYAKAQDLPSFPSSGNTASSASAAALLAKDYKMKELWQPEASTAASRASLLAAKDGGKLDLWQASPSAAGNSAATLAMRNKGLSPELDRGYTADGSRKALLAATLSVNKGRDTAAAAPAPAVPAAYPDSQNSAANALNAATVSHRTSTLKDDGWDSAANQAARVKNAHMSKDMFGERPPVEIEQEEKRYNAALRASAVTMAKQMYDYQNKQAAFNDLTGGAEGAQAAHARQASSSSTDIKQEAMRYIHLQDAAHKLAQERLAKVDKSMEDQRYREYYGYGGSENSPKKSLSTRLSARGRQRKRGSSDATGDADDSDDEENARRIRSQMSQLNSGLSNVDKKKQTDDRAKLLAAAEKRVHAQMHDMDEKVFQETGKVPPAMMEEWEAKARERAQKEKELQAANPGKTHIGGGKFIDQAEIEAIAAAKLKPTLDEINDTAEKRRARDEELRLEREAAERDRWVEKQNKKEEKQEQKRVKNEERAAQKKIKDEEKAIAKKQADEDKVKREEAKAAIKRQQDEEKARKDEEKRLAKEEKRKSKAPTGLIITGGAAGAATAAAAEEEERKDVADSSEAKPSKRNSVLGRMFSRRSKVPEDAAVAEPETTHEPQIKEEEKEESSTAPVVGGLVAGTAVAGGAAAVAEHEHDEHEVSPIEETTAPAPALQRAHTGDYTDALPTSPAVERPAKPDLERHITTIDTSDDEDEVDNKKANREAVAIAPAPVSSSLSEPFDEPVAVAAEPEVEKKPEVLAADISHDPTPVERSHDVVAPIEPAAQEPSTVTPKPISEAVPETAKVESFQERAEAKAEAEDAKPVAAVAAPVASTTDATRNESVTSQPKPIAGRGGGIGIAGYDTGEPKPYTGPAPNTIGPHKSDIANILDPRVLPVPELMKEKGTAGPHKSDMLNILDPRVESDPVKAAEKAQNPSKHEHSKLHKKNAPAASASDVKFASEKKEDKNKKGLRGFMNKLRKRESRADTKADKAKSSKEEATKADDTMTPVTDLSAQRPTAEETQAAETASKDVSPISPEEATTVIANPGSVSPSSFRRHAGDLNDLDDVSSSGLEEDDLGRGRAGAGASRGKGKSKAVEKKSSSNDEDQFEEARDHFDEGLAPPPMYAGQAKSESPVRDTRFREVL